MKRIILVVAGLMILMNIILSLVIEDYSSMAMLQGCVVVVISAVILMLVQCMKFNDAYRYSLNTLFSIVTIGEWFTAFFATNELINNWFVIVALVFFILEVTLLAASNIVTNINSKNKLNHESINM